MKARKALTEFIDDVIYELVLTNRHLTDVSDLSDSEYKVVWYLHRNPHSTMKQIAQFSSVSNPRASKIIDSLVSHGYVERETNFDRRRVSVSLTQLGQQMITNTVHSHEALSESLLAQLTQQERAAFHELLQKCMNGSTRLS